MIIMTAKMQFKIDVISKVADGRLSKHQAAKLLQKSVRMVERYLDRYKLEGVNFVVHKNTGKPPSNKHSDKEKRRVQKLLQEKYYDFNLTHFKEKLEQEEGILVARETIRSWATEIKLVKKSRKRRSRKKTYRERMPNQGLMVQLDGSPHKWFGNRQTCLIAAVDDATSELHAEFFESETTLGCMSVIAKIVKKKGIFHTLYVDRAGIFGGAKRQMFSQLQRACRELGIEIIFAHSPEAKGRIERVFQTLQDRLIAEMRLKGIRTIQSANCFLQDEFIPNEWSKKFVVLPAHKDSYYRKCTKNLSEIMVIKEVRRVSKDQTISFQSKDYVLGSSKSASLSKQHIELRTNRKSQTSAYFAGKKVKMNRITKPKRPSHIQIEVQRILEAVRMGKKTGNIKKASEKYQVSRGNMYRAIKMIEQHGLRYFKKTFNQRIHQHSKKKTLANLVVKFSLENPHLGENQVALHLNQLKDVSISRGTVRAIWLNHNMQTIALRQTQAKKS